MEQSWSPYERREVTEEVSEASTEYTDTSMESQKEPRINRSWEKTFRELADFVRYAGSGERLKFAHVQGAPASGKTSQVPLALMGDVADENTLVIMVTDDRQAPHLNEYFDRIEASEKNDYIPLATVSYHQMIQIIKLNRSNDDTGTPWRTATPPRLGWASEAVLPERVVVVVDVDPWFSADFVLAFTLIAHWATTIVEERKCAAISIVTMSSDEPSPILGKLVSGPGQWRPPVHFRLPDPFTDPMSESPNEPLVQAVTTTELVVAIRGSIIDNIGDRQIFIAFNPMEVEDFFHEDLEEEQMNVFHLSSQPSGQELAQALQANPNDRYEQCRFVFAHHGSSPGVYISGFDRVHIILGQHYMTEFLDPKTNLLVQRRRALSPEEMADQVSWARRTDHDVDQVDVYRLEPHEKESSTERPHRVANLQMGGFLCALTEFADWGLDLVHVARSAVDSLAFFEVARHMSSQRVLSFDEHGCSLLLHEEAQPLFRDLLPCLNYDYRLAMFVAQPVNDFAVMVVKVQLAMLLCMNFNDTLMRVGSPITGELIKNCSGAAAGLADSGSLWLWLGLWRRSVCLVQGRRSLESRTTRVLGGAIGVWKESLPDVHNNLVRLTNILDQHGITINVFDEVDQQPLDAECCEELQRHLLRAFLYGRVEGYPSEEPNGRPKFVSASTRDEVKMDFAGQSIDLDSMLERDSEAEMWCGITTVFVAHGDQEDKIAPWDWTWIPATLVDEWFAERAQEAVEEFQLEGGFMDLD